MNASNDFSALSIYYSVLYILFFVCYCWKSCSGLPAKQRQHISSSIDNLYLISTYFFSLYAFVYIIMVLMGIEYGYIF